AGSSQQTRVYGARSKRSWRLSMYFSGAAASSSLFTLSRSRPASAYGTVLGEAIREEWPRLSAWRPSVLCHCVLALDNIEIVTPTNVNQARAFLQIDSCSGWLP